MRNGFKKITALLMAALMLLAALPASALGTEQYSNKVLPGISLASIVEPDTPVVTYVFHVGDTTTSQSVKDGETLVEPEAPTAADGKVFIGWYTAADGGDQFTSFGAQTVLATATVDLYARFDDAYYVYFYTPDGATLMHTEKVQDHNAHDFSSVTYQLDDPTKGVIGWASTPNDATDVSKNVIVPAGASSVSLYAIIGDGFYVTFHTGDGTVVAPRFVPNGQSLDLTTVPAPTLFGYAFGGWYTDGDCTIAASSPITASVDLYAKWNPETAQLTVVFWYENADDANYSYAGSTQVSAATGANVTSDDRKDTDFTGRDNEHFTYNDEKTETVTVKGDNSSVLNVYFKRNEYTLVFGGTITYTCTKNQHQHSHSECCTKRDFYYHHDCNTDKCPNGGKEHVHSTDTCPFTYTGAEKVITAKYQADIKSNFPIKNGNNTITWDVPDGCVSFKPDTWLSSIDIMPGEDIVFTKHGEESEAKLYYYIETLNGAEGTRTHESRKFTLYKQIDLPKYCRLTYTEEFHPITGFTQWDSDPKFDKMEQGGVAYEGFIDYRRIYYIKDNNYLYYTRNSYNLKFSNHGTELTDKQKTLQYEAPIISAYNFTPDRPTTLDPNVQYTFAGWYTTADCFDGTEFVWNTTKMPANDVMLYAKWVPQKYTVTFDLGYETTQTPPEKQEVDAKTTATKPDDPVRDGWTFVGWFDEDDTTGIPFNFATQIVKDTNLIARWTTSQTVKVQYDANGGTGTVPVDGNKYADGSKAAVMGKGELTSTNGLVFLGWATDKDAATAVYQSGDLMPISVDKAVNGIITLYAVWGPAPATTTLTYNANYGETPATVSHEVDGSTVLPNNAKITLYGEDTFTRPGYKLVGWANNADATTEDYALGAQVIVDNNLQQGEVNVLYAVWEKTTVTLTIKKVVAEGGDQTKQFTFTGSYTESGATASTNIDSFSLKNGVTKEIEVPIGATLTITETGAADYTTTATYGTTSCTVADNDASKTISGITVNETDTLITVTNTIKTGELVVKKNVTGGWGDKSKPFSFTHDYGNGEKNFYLSDYGKGEVVYTLTGIPYGTVVTITEADYSGEGYTTTNDYVENGGNTTTVTISAASTTVTFTNTKEANPDTGVLLDSLPYILILAAIAVVVGVVVVRKRRSRDDD